MRIDATNGNLLNVHNFSLHDALLMEIQFDISENALYVLAKAYESPFSNLEIHYHNVIGLEGITCDVWSVSLDSLTIFSLDYMTPSESDLIKRIFSEYNSDNIKQSRLITPESYIETVLTCTSGNRWRIACEYIEINETIC